MDQSNVDYEQCIDGNIWMSPQTLLEMMSVSVPVSLTHQLFPLLVHFVDKTTNCLDVLLESFLSVRVD